MPTSLLLTLRFHEGRYHGAGDWPPSPARLFQALVSGAACGEELLPAGEAALRRMETWRPPIIAAPPTRAGQSFTLFVPNNDRDAALKGQRTEDKIRSPKHTRPRLFDPSIALLYLWNAPQEDPDPERLRAIAQRLYQLGRGPDMAFATAEWLDPGTAEARLAAHPGPVFRPSEEGRRGMMLACPEEGSLNSLLSRHAAQAARFHAAHGRLLRRLGRYDAAEAAFTRAVEIAGESHPSYGTYLGQLEFVRHERAARTP